MQPEVNVGLRNPPKGEQMKLKLTKLLRSYLRLQLHTAALGRLSNGHIMITETLVVKYVRSSTKGCYRARFYWQSSTFSKNTFKILLASVGDRIKAKLSPFAGNIREHFDNILSFESFMEKTAVMGLQTPSVL